MRGEGSTEPRTTALFIYAQPDRTQHIRAVNRTADPYRTQRQERK